VSAGRGSEPIDGEDVGPGRARRGRRRGRGSRRGLQHGGISRWLSVFGTLPLFTEREHQQFEMVVPGETIPSHTHTAAAPGAVVSSIVGAHGARGFGDVQLGALFAIRARPDSRTRSSTASATRWT
jgi:hypothetical protein